MKNKKVKETINYLLQTTEDFGGEYFKPNQDDVNNMIEILSANGKLSIPNDYVEFVQEFGHIGGPLGLHGISINPRTMKPIYTAVVVTERFSNIYSIDNMIVVRERGNGDFDFIDLSKNNKVKSEIYSFNHETGSIEKLTHNSFFTYCLKYMLLFLEDEFDYNNNIEEFESLKEKLKQFEEH